MPQAQVSLPVFLEHVDADLARLGHIGVEYLCEKVACTATAPRLVQEMDSVKTPVGRPLLDTAENVNSSTSCRVCNAAFMQRNSMQ